MDRTTVSGTVDVGSIPAGGTLFAKLKLMPAPHHNYQPSFATTLSVAQKEVVAQVVQEHSPAAASILESLPTEPRIKIQIFYSWLRIAYQLAQQQARAQKINNAESISTTPSFLNQYRQAFIQAWKTGRSDHILTQLMVHLAKHEGLERDYFLQWLDDFENLLSQQTVTSIQLENIFFNKHLDPVVNIARRLLFGQKKLQPNQAWVKTTRWFGWVIILSQLKKNFEVNKQILLPNNRLKNYGIDFQLVFNSPEEIKSDQLGSLVNSYPYHDFIHDLKAEVNQNYEAVNQLIKTLPPSLQPSWYIARDYARYLLDLVSYHPPLAWSMVVRPTTKKIWLTSFKWRFELSWWPELRHRWHQIVRFLSKHSRAQLQDLGLVK